MTRRDKFVVGYSGADECVWGCDSDDGAMRWACPVTAQKAVRMARQNVSFGAQAKIIYCLVPVPLAEVKAQAARERAKRKGAKP